MQARAWSMDAISELSQWRAPCDGRFGNAASTPLPPTRRGVSLGATTGFQHPAPFVDRADGPMKSLLRLPVPTALNGARDSPAGSGGTRHTSPYTNTVYGESQCSPEGTSAPGRDDECDFIRSSFPGSPLQSYDQLVNDDAASLETQFHSRRTSPPTAFRWSSSCFGAEEGELTDFSELSPYVYQSPESPLPPVSFQLIQPELTVAAIQRTTGQSRVLRSLTAEDLSHSSSPAPWPAPVAGRLSVPTPTFSTAASSSIGRRSRQEDAFTVLQGAHRLTAAEPQLAGGRGGAPLSQLPGHTSVLPTFFAGVFDGHGHGGEVVANFASHAVPEHLRRSQLFSADLPSAVVAAFRNADAQLKQTDCLEGSLCGTTAAVVCIRGNDIVVGNLGDSRSVMSVGGVAVALSWDHKAGVPAETARIVALGGTVTSSRIGGELEVSRGLGDFELKSPNVADGASCIVSNIADITSATWTQDCDFCLIASDGLWDVMSSQDAVDFIHDHLRKSFAFQDRSNVEVSREVPVELEEDDDDSEPAGEVEALWESPAFQCATPEPLHVSHSSPLLQNSQPPTQAARYPHWADVLALGAECSTHTLDAEASQSRTPAVPHTPRDAMQLALDALIQHAVHIRNSNDNTTAILIYPKP